MNLRPAYDVYVSALIHRRFPQKPTTLKRSHRASRMDGPADPRRGLQLGGARAVGQDNDGIPTVALDFGLDQYFHLGQNLAMGQKNQRQESDQTVQRYALGNR